ncbi:hypothetical protein [Nocardioides sp.]|uniref:hypothetical protein n=1 Tax=Nocardioides sp. TaxID=35761 RepID=UPI002B53923A|nr:hypothetical protein [Nocardioides sp.]HXH79529.1 hypothetical protein [Nocardioides sp.]
MRDWLQGLYDAHGYLTPEIVREAARDKKSPGHVAVFGMDAAQAAEAYYLLRAHKLIQSVRIIRVDQPDKEPVTLRAYHAVPGNAERSYVYRSADDLSREPDQLALARNEALRRLRDAERSITSLDLLSPAPAQRQTRRALRHVSAAQEALGAA